MKRKNVLRGYFQPELSHFNEKYLRQQSAYITQRGCILETQTSEDEEINVTAENPVRPSTTENNNITEMISTSPQAENINEAITAINSE